MTTCRYRCFAILDHILVLFLFFPLMVSYWRGIWDLVGVYIFPNHEPLNHWVACGIGVVGVCGYFTARWLDEKLDKKNTFIYILITRTFMYLFGACLMTYWRGFWLLANFYLGVGWKGSLGGASVSLWLLWILRCSRNVIFPPFFTILDTREDLLIPASRFSEKTKGKPALFALDAIFSQAVVWALVIFTWRSGWNVLDHFIFPENLFLSNISCLIAGYILVIFLFVIQTPLAMISSHLDKESNKLPKVIYEDFMYLIVFCATIVIWRGAWNLNATYMLSDTTIGGWVNHIAGTVGLMVTQTFSYAGAVGVAVDGSEPGGQAFFPTKWVRSFCKFDQDEPQQEKDIEKDIKLKSNSDGPLPIALEAKKNLT